MVAVPRSRALAELAWPGAVEGPSPPRLARERAWLAMGAVMAVCWPLRVVGGRIVGVARKGKPGKKQRPRRLSSALPRLAAAWGVPGIPDHDAMGARVLLPKRDVEGRWAPRPR